MKQKVEEAAIDYSISKTNYRRYVLKEVNEDDYSLRKNNCCEDFKAGIEWREKKSLWVRVYDKLPPFEEQVLLFNKDVNRVELQYFEKGYDIRAFCAWYRISHWRLANLPK